MSSPRLHLSIWTTATCGLLLAVAISFPSLSISIAAQSADNPPTPANAKGENKPYVRFRCGYIQKLGQPFLVHVDIQPPQAIPVEVRMERGNIVYSQNTFRLRPGETNILEATVARTQTGFDWVHGTGLEWVNGIQTSFGESEAEYAPVSTGYLGQLKLNSTDPLPYEAPSTLFFRIVDSDGKPLKIDAAQTVELYSSDATITHATSQPNTDFKVLPLDARETETGQFQIRPKSAFGGNIHLTARLKFGDDVLSEETFALIAQPAYMLLLALAIAGALLHAVYKINRLSPFTWPETISICIASVIAGCLAFLIANYDLFGLKLDPHVLRTYPLLGFLLSYFGIDVLANKFSVLKAKPVVPDETVPQPQLGAIRTIATPDQPPGVPESAKTISKV
jgi:hypothetical protein